MAFTSFGFVPSDGVKNATSFPNPANGTAARKQIQDILDQIKDYMNSTLVAELGSATDSDSGADNVGATAVAAGFGSTVQSNMEAIYAAITGVVLGSIPNDSLTEAKMAAAMKKAAGGVAEYDTVNSHVGLTPATSAHGMDSSIAKFKSGTGTFTDNDTAQTFADAFCTANSLVVVNVTSGTEPQGTWTVDAGEGSFTITSTNTESADITFDYFIIKVF